jgi:hypothetical protein
VNEKGGFFGLKAGLEKNSKKMEIPVAEWKRIPILAAPSCPATFARVHRIYREQRRKSSC